MSERENGLIVLRKMPDWKKKRIEKLLWKESNRDLRIYILELEKKIKAKRKIITQLRTLVDETKICKYCGSAR